MTTGPFDNLVETPSFAVFSIDHNAVLIWKQPPIPEGIEACRRLFAVLKRRRPQTKFGHLAIVEVRAGTNMAAPVREALSAMLREYEQSIAVAAIVFEGTGFRASIVRSVVAAITRASRLDFPSTVESSLVDAVNRLVDGQPEGSLLTTQQLTETLRRFRSRPGYDTAADGR